MIRHTLKLIYRSIKRFKSIFFINLVGMSSGLACALFIYLWVSDEQCVDKFHKNDERLYYAWEHRIKSDGIWTARTTSGPTAASLAEDMEEVELTCAATPPYPSTLSVGDKIIKSPGRYVGKDFFKMFSYPLIYGRAEDALKDKTSIVISQSLANKLFNSTDVVGKMIDYEHEDQFLITGVFKDVPQASSEQFEFLIPWEKFEMYRPGLKGWGSTGPATYVLLKEGVDVIEFNKKIAGYIREKTNDEISHRTLFLKKYSEIYLHGNYENGVMSGGRSTYVTLFSIIAVFILFIACINFMNLSTAKATSRIKEIGIKKAIGAGRNLLIMQYLVESIVLSFLSMAFAILLVDICMGQFNVITGKQLALEFTPNFILIIFSIALITGVLAGSYPAIYLSGFQPATVMKGSLSTSFGEVFARKGLVVFQFALSVILIVSVLIVQKQIEFVQSVNLGYDRENILYFYREGKLYDTPYMETVLSEMKKIPGVISASTTSHDMTGHDSGTSGLVWEGKDPEDRTEFEHIAVDYDLIETLGIKMVAGRTFSRAHPGDTAKLIITERGIKYMGLKDPIGTKVKLWGNDMEIVGVAKDFHYESLHENLKPIFFRLASDADIVMLKLSPGNASETISAIQRLHDKLNPGFPFDYKFLDAQYQAQYIAEQRVSILSRFFAGLAILISCLGLFGLAAFSAERRIKEIGIRKVLGSSVFGIVTLLSVEFTKIVLLSLVFALPLSYFLSKFWLESFAFRTPIRVEYFIYAGAAALAVAWITVGLQTYKAARVNPVKCLKEL
jgi:predicted permease